jgi:hypothetical protein
MRKGNRGHTGQIDLAILGNDIGRQSTVKSASDETAFSRPTCADRISLVLFENAGPQLETVIDDVHHTTSRVVNLVPIEVRQRETTRSGGSARRGECGESRDALRNRRVRYGAEALVTATECAPSVSPVSVDSTFGYIHELDNFRSCQPNVDNPPSLVEIRRWDAGHSRGKVQDDFARGGLVIGDRQELAFGWGITARATRTAYLQNPVGVTGTATALTCNRAHRK